MNEISQNLENPSKLSLPKSSIMSPKIKKTKKSIKFAFDLNPLTNEHAKGSIFTNPSARNSSFFQNSPDFAFNFDNFSPHRKRTTSMSIAKLMSRLKMGVNNMTTSYHKSLIDQMSEIKKDTSQIHSLDNYTTEELLSLGILILQKPSYLRSLFDIKMLVKCTQSVKFFNDMIINDDLSTHEQCCRVMIHKFYKRGDIIFREGTEGSTFYIILKGSVGVYIPERRPSLLKSQDNDSPRNKKNSIVSAPLESSSSFKFHLVRMDSKLDQNTNKNMVKGSPTVKSIVLDKKPSLTSAKFKDFMNANPAFKDKSNESEGNRVKVLVQGQSFGELALLDNRPRAATIICEEDSHFAVLEKKSFSEILKEKEKKKLYNQIEFFASMKMFNSWSFNAVKQLFLTTTEADFKKNMAVYSEGDAVGDLYLIKSGEFKMIKQLKWEKNIVDDNNRSTNESHLQINTKNIKKQFEIGLLGPGESFGEEELVKNCPRICTVVCSSFQGTLYVLKKKDFFKKVLKDKYAQQCMEEQIEAKSQWRNKRIQEYFEILEEKNAEGAKIPKNYTITQSFLEFLKKNDVNNQNSIISNKPKKNFDLSEFIPKKKNFLNPIDKSFLDPIKLQAILKERSVMKLLSSSSHKKNFMILNAILRNRQQNKPKNDENENECEKKKRNNSEPNLKTSLKSNQNLTTARDKSFLEYKESKIKQILNVSVSKDKETLTLRSFKNSSFINNEKKTQSNELNIQTNFKRRENFKKLALESLHTTRSQNDKFNRIHHQEKEFFFHTKRYSFGNGILPLKYFSDKIKSSNSNKKIF